MIKIFYVSENEAIFNVIIDNRLARGSISTSLLYCIKLREMKQKAKNYDTASHPAKKPRFCKDDVFLNLPPMPLNNHDCEDENKKDINTILPKVPYLSPSAASSSPALSSYLSQPPLCSPISLPRSPQQFVPSHQPMISIPMPDISSLFPTPITSTSETASSVLDSHLIQNNNQEFSKTLPTSGALNNKSMDSGELILPINLSTLVPVSKQSLNFEDMETVIPPMPIATTYGNSILGAQLNQMLPSFTLSTLASLTPLSQLISHQSSQNAPVTKFHESIFTMSGTTNYVATAKDARVHSNGARKSRSSSHVALTTAVVWPGVDAIVESYRKYDQGMKYLLKLSK